jgi:hypothetical protein
MPLCIAVDLIIQSTLMAALALRLAAIFDHNPEQTTYLHLRSFQVLSMCAPLIWISKSNGVELGMSCIRLSNRVMRLL